MTPPPRAIASVLVCNGCCCGHTEKGKPALPKDRIEAAWAECDLESAVRLRFVDCLGPCNPANFVVIKTADESIWLAGLDSAVAYDALIEWASASRRQMRPADLPGALVGLQIPAPRD